MAIFKFRVILDADGEVFRDLEITDNQSLEALHGLIKSSFGFKCNEMASFYLSNAKWEQGREIPLFNFDDKIQPMEELILSKTLKKGSRMIYVYDLMLMWTFFVELADVYAPKAGKSYPHVALSHGVLPKAAPSKIFKAEEPEIEFESGYDSIYDAENEDH